MKTINATNLLGALLLVAGPQLLPATQCSAQEAQNSSSQESMSRQTHSFEAFQAATALRHLASARSAISHKDLSGAQTDVAKNLSTVGKSLQTGCPLRTSTGEKLDLEGEPAAEILHQAWIHPADLIVMGTHGRTGLQYMLLGSVAGNVVDRADRPVLTIRPEAFHFEMP